MKKQLLTFLTICTFGVGHTQVKDISFTISPVADYTFFDKHAGFKDAFSAGGKIGFGFGEYLELRAIYMQSIGLETNFSDFGLANYNNNLFTPQSATLKNYGGEIKVNLSSRRFIPYLTLGSGVQQMSLDNQDDLSQIYFNTGLGIKTKITDRIVFTVEGKFYRYNFNAAENLLTPGNAIDYDIANNPTKSEALNNFMLQTSLQFYLGGRKPGEASSLDNTYANSFKNGLRGTQLIFEPSLNYVNFDKNSSYKDAYLLGLYAGMDFNSYIGIRAFYLRAMPDEKISFDFDPLDMYGLELRARLNDANGVTPYIILGGGLMNVTKNYVAVNNLEAKNQEFVQGGLGLNIPLSKRILITSGVRAMITSETNVQNVASTDDLQTHLMYNAGIKLSLGGKTSRSSLNQTSVSNALFAPKAEDDYKLHPRIMVLKKGYETELEEVNIDLKKANDNNDYKKVVSLLEQKRTIQNALYEVNVIHYKLQNSKIDSASNTIIDSANESKVKDLNMPLETEKQSPKNESSDEYLKLTPAEFERLIDTVLQSNSNKNNQIEENAILKKRIEALEKVLKQKEAAKTPANPKTNKTPVPNN